MQHLDLTQFRLLNEMLKEGREDTEKGWSEGFVFGAVHDGVPTDPTQPSCCAYARSGLPQPNLGSFPRKEIVDELNQDANKEVKQRRDLSFPVAETVTQRNLLYLFDHLFFVYFGIALQGSGSLFTLFTHSRLYLSLFLRCSVVLR